MSSFETRLTIGRPLDHVFAIYTHPDTWYWCTFLKTVRWVSGNPWEEGSRLKIASFDSFGITTDQVLLHFEPKKRLDFISHFAGITLQSRIFFRALSATETEIHAQMEFVGTLSRVVSVGVDDILQARIAKMYEELKIECERVPVGQIETQGGRIRQIAGRAPETDS